jgi:hypothetical protein
MASNKILNAPPVALTLTLTTNIFNVGGSVLTTAQTGFTFSGLYAVIRHARVLNKTGTAATVSLWKGASAGNVAGTEWNWQATSVAANSFLDEYGIARFDTADYLVGGAGTVTALTLMLEGEIGVAG